MLAFQHVTCLFVIKASDVPLNQRKIQAIVLGMATSALLT